jgi:metal-responsive CopG/Arc/MetJ family transcriptional regulator
VERRPVLVQFDADLLERLDRFWPEAPYPSRRAAILAAVELMLAQHAAHLVRERAAPPTFVQARAWTADDRAGERSRPITADLSDF